MLHLVLHDVLEAFGLFLQQPFLKQVRRGDGASLSVSPVPGGQRHASRFIRQELESSVA